MNPIRNELLYSTVHLYTPFKWDDARPRHARGGLEARSRILLIVFNVFKSLANKNDMGMWRPK